MNNCVCGKEIKKTNKYCSQSCAVSDRWGNFVGVKERKRKRLACFCLCGCEKSIKTDGAKFATKKCSWAYKRKNVIKDSVILPLCVCGCGKRVGSEGRSFFSRACSIDFGGSYIPSVSNSRAFYDEDDELYTVTRKNMIHEAKNGNKSALGFLRQSHITRVFSNGAWLEV